MRKMTRGLLAGLLMGAQAYATEADTLHPQEIQAFKDGKRELGFVQQIARKARSAGDTATVSMIVSEYAAGLKENERFQEGNLDLIAMYGGIRHPAFAVFYNDTVRVNAVLGEGASARIVRAGVHNYYFPAFISDGVYKNGAPAFDSLKKDMQARYGKDGERAYLRLRALYSFIRWESKDGGMDALNDWYDHKSRLYKRFPDELMSSGAMEVNNDAFFTFDNIADKEKLRTVLAWSKVAIEREPENGNWLDTYANILYKLGQKQEAIVLQEKAVKLAPFLDDVKANLEKMKKGEATWKNSL